MKVFSKAKYIADMGQDAYEVHHKWVDFCDGMEVVGTGPVRTILGFDVFVHEDWVEDVRYEITIRSDSKTTTAQMVVNGKTVKSARADCHPDDRFNFKVGAQLAFQRLFEKKKELKPGDKVRVRKDLIPNRAYGADCFTEDMLPYRGKTVTISYVVAEGIYKIEEDEEYGWSFTKEMFEV